MAFLYEGGPSVMNRLAFVIAIVVLGGALGVLACGGGSDKPPLTPDSEHAMDDAGGGAMSADGGK
jgi:hypothetical protein